MRLEQIASRTLAYYASNAQTFWDHTRDHDVSQNVAALLEALVGLPGSPSRRILDFGCGPGRDLAAFRSLGHRPVGLDGCTEFAAMARDHSGCEVIEQTFFNLSLGESQFDGIFANASLFHVPSAQLPTVLGALFAALVPGGVIFCSNPRAFGEDSEGWDGERYGSFLTVESWTQVMSAAGFLLERQFLRPAGRPPSQQPWLAMVWRKPTGP